MVTILNIIGCAFAILALMGICHIIYEILKAPIIDDDFNTEEKDNGEEETDQSANGAQD